MIYRISIFILLAVATAVTSGCASEAALKTCKVKLGKGEYPGDPWIRIPVTVARDSVYDFIFDTGHTLNLIDTSLIKNVRLKKSFSMRKRVSRVDSVYKETVTFYTPYLSDIIGDNKRGYPLLIDSFPMQGNFIFGNQHNIIGKGTISRYSWLFDFSTDTVTISNGDIPLPVMPGEEVLTLKWSYRNFLGSPKVKMAIGGDSKHMKCTKTYFDTGYSAWYQLRPDTLLSVDMLFTWSLFKKFYDNFIDAAYKNKYSPDILRTAVLDIKHMQVNGIKLQSVQIIEAPDNGRHTSYISANFARRFRLMYIDKKRRQVQFIGRNPYYKYKSMIHINQLPQERGNMQSKQE